MCIYYSLILKELCYRNLAFCDRLSSRSLREPDLGKPAWGGPMNGPEVKERRGTMRPGGAGDPRSQGEERILGGPWLRSLIVWRRSRRTVGNRTLGGCRIRRAPFSDSESSLRFRPDPRQPGMRRSSRLYARPVPTIACVAGGS